MNLIHRARVLLVESAKVLPFVFCFVVCVSYVEAIYALSIGDFLLFEGSYVLNKPISFFLGNLFVYDWYTIAVLTILSLSMETCLWNKLSVVYLAINIIEREYFITIELYPEYVYAICLANVITSAFLVYKGAKIVTQK